MARRDSRAPRRVHGEFYEGETLALLWMVQQYRLRQHQLEAMRDAPRDRLFALQREIAAASRAMWTHAERIDRLSVLEAHMALPTGLEETRDLTARLLQMQQRQ